MSDTEWRKFQDMGGADWLRKIMRQPVIGEPVAAVEMLIRLRIRSRGPR
mgnify:CR=1 FL=1